MDTISVTTTQFEDLISAVQSGISSLRSCLSPEESSEVAILRTRLNDLRCAKLVRTNSELQNRAAEWTRLAEKALEVYSRA